MRDDTERDAVMMREMRGAHNLLSFLFLYFIGVYTSHSLTAPTSTSWVTWVLFVVTPMNWEYTSYKSYSFRYSIVGIPVL